MKFVFLIFVTAFNCLSQASPVSPDCPIIEKQDYRGNISLLSPLTTTISKRDKTLVQVDYAGYSGLIFTRADYVTFKKVLVQAVAAGKMVYIGAIGPNPIGVADEDIPVSCLPKKLRLRKTK